MAEQLTGENLAPALKRRGSTVKPLMMWAGRELCGLTLREIGKQLGGMDYNAVNMALHRWEAKIKLMPSVLMVVKQLRRMCSV